MKIVTVALLCENGNYLLCQRGGNDALSLKWEFPGGKLEQGEMPEACIVREIKEELCLDIQVQGHCCDVLYQCETSEFLLKAYFATITGGKMKLMVHQAMAWVEPQRLLNYDLLPADVEIAVRLIGKRDERDSDYGSFPSGR